MRLRVIGSAVAVGLLIAAGLAVAGTYWPAIAPGLSGSPEGEHRGEAPIRSRVDFAALMDRNVYDRGEEAQVDVLITNADEGPVTVWSRDGCTFWFYVTDEAGSVVYQFPEHVMACTMAIVEFTIGPGESYSAVSRLWDLHDTDGTPLPPGRYNACPTTIHATIDPEPTHVACWAFEIR